MTFEKQQCEKCKGVCFCILHYTTTRARGHVGNWYCENCYSWLLEDANHKDQVRQIMINCGIEDLENG